MTTITISTETARGHREFRFSGLLVTLFEVQGWLKYRRATAHNFKMASRFNRID